MRDDSKRRRWKTAASVLCSLSAALLITNELAAKPDSRIKVKVSAAVGEIDASGKQTISVTFVVDDKWHIYANPARNETLKSVATEVKIFVADRVTNADIRYPAGKFHQDLYDPKNTYMIYEGKIDVQAVVQRAPGDNRPLEVDVTFSACDNGTCYPTAQLRLNQANGFSHVPKK